MCWPLVLMGVVLARLLTLPERSELGLPPIWWVECQSSRVMFDTRSAERHRLATYAPQTVAVGQENIHYNPD